MDVFEATFFEYIYLDEACFVSGYNSVEYSTLSPMEGVESLIVRGEFSARDEDQSGDPEACCQAGWDNEQEGDGQYDDPLLEACV